MEWLNLVIMCDETRRPDGTLPRRIGVCKHSCKHRTAPPCPGEALRRGALIQLHGLMIFMVRVRTPVHARSSRVKNFQKVVFELNRLSALRLCNALVPRQTLLLFILLRSGMAIEKQSCQKCSHSWYPNRETIPKVCPRCKSYNWKKNAGGKEHLSPGLPHQH